MKKLHAKQLDEQGGQPQATTEAQVRACGGLGSKGVAYLVSGTADPLMGPSSAGGMGAVRRALPAQGGHTYSHG